MCCVLMHRRHCQLVDDLRANASHQRACDARGVAPGHNPPLEARALCVHSQHGANRGLRTRHLSGRRRSFSFWVRACCCATEQSSSGCCPTTETAGLDTHMHNTHTHTHTYMCAHARTHTLAHRYVATKYVGEQLLKAAAKQGVPTTLFRPAFISNHSRTGQGNVSDFLNRYLAGCVQLGAALGGDAFDKPTTVLDMTPVDYVAGAIVFLARRRRSEGQSFHILSSLDKLPTYSTVARVMVECGYRVESVEYVCFCVCAAAAAAAVVLVVDVVVWSGCECWWPGVSCCSRRMQGQM